MGMSEGHVEQRDIEVVYGLICVPHNRKTRTRIVAHALHNKTKAADIVRSAEVKGNYFQLNITTRAHVRTASTNRRGCYIEMEIPINPPTREIRLA